MNALLMDEAHVRCHFAKTRTTALIKMSHVDEEGETGAKRWSTCHTRGSPRPAVHSGLERYWKKRWGSREKQDRVCTVVGVKKN